MGVLGWGGRLDAYVGARTIACLEPFEHLSGRLDDLGESVGPMIVGVR